MVSTLGASAPTTFYAMQFQIREHNGDYIVEAYIIEDFNSLRGYWKPLRNFGQRQGDAICFKEYDCPKLENAMINLLIKAYKPERKYIRQAANKFRIEQ